MSDLRPLSASIQKLTSATFSKKFVALGRVLNNWDDIIGPDMAVKTQPIKIHYRKPKDKSEKPQATLDIAVNSADATSLHYQKDLILARINQIFGDNWITALRFIHIPANTSNFVPPSVPAKITMSDKENLTTLLSTIDDDEIRKCLERFGLGILGKSR